MRFKGEPAPAAPFRAVFATLILAAATITFAADDHWKTEVEKSVRDVNFHGVILIQDSGRTVFQQGFGEAGATESADTRYWIASISKSFTATLIFRLEERGALKRSDTLDKFFPDAPADKKSITIQQLLTHTSGLPNKYASEGVVDRAEAVRTILALPLLQEPGKSFKYTNDGYSLLAAIAEVAAKTPFRKLLEQEIFRPAQMTNSGLWPTCPGAAPVLPLSEMPPQAMQRENWGYKGPDGICSDTEDLARWMNALIAGKFLRRETLEEMWKPQTRAGEDEVASGWFGSTSAAGTRIVWTRGTDHGHNSILKYYPTRKLLVVSLSSSKDPDGPLLARLLVNGLEKRLSW